MTHRDITDSPSSSSQGFTEGDLTIQSADGVNFQVHASILCVASPVFSDLLKGRKNDEIVRLSENAAVLALMLNFIYPKPTPIIKSMNLMNDAVRVANIYQLDSMKTRLREQLVLVASPVSVHANPFGALCVASTHGFVPEAKLAAENALKQYNFGKGEDLTNLVNATQNPATAELVKLTGVPLVKTRVLVDVLFHSERAPMKLDKNIDVLACVNCRGAFRNYSRQSSPEWQARWALWIFDEIKDKPISEWESLFSPSNVLKAFSQSHLSRNVYSYTKGLEYRTCTCLDVIENSTNATALQSWVNGVYEHLMSRLAPVAELEAAHNPSQERGEE
ncbi:BTB/POZ domain protein [Rhizoctonia solani 123E]|uniref:BTB/POZ domain protein n=1 Tax=Rhizoctonia solani 123E TaxID=1423351 RepID=A0A074RLS1_9AGAM|nr:BTB/POZ domain protein [Rhizoctonia solani 123E]